MRELSSQINKSLKVASSTVRFGGRTVKVCGNTIKKTIHAPAEAKKNIKLLKVKFRSLQKATAKGKLKKAVGVVGKTAVKGGKAAVKGVKSGAIGGARFAANSADRLVDSIDNDTVRFAKQSADAARAAASAAKKAGKVAGKTINKTSKAVRTLATKKGRRKLSKSVKRKINNVKRNVRQAKKVAKATAKTAKATAKVAKAAAKLVVNLVGKVINLIVSTAPWSLIIIGVVVLVLLLVFLVTNSFAATAGGQERIAGWTISSSDTVEDVYTNIRELAVRMETACENSFSNALKQEITNFCSEAATPPHIISYKIGEGSGTIYPARSADGQINAKIDSLIASSTAYSSKYYSDFMAALVVLMMRAHNTEDNFALEKFTVADMEKLLGGVNNNSCEYGSTFFIKTTSITDGETCPGAACKKKKKPGCDCGGKDENGNKKCDGHPYCDNDHEKMTVTLQTVAEYTGKSIPEVYGFNESDTQYFYDVSTFISELLIEMSLSEGGTSS